MRRLVAVFAPRRADRSDAASSVPDDQPVPKQGPLHTLPKRPSNARFFRSLSRKAQPPAEPIVVCEQAQASSSSSSSAGPSTPDDDRGSFVRSHDRKHWSPWPSDHTVPATPLLDPAQARSVIHHPAHASNHSVRAPTHPIRVPPQHIDTDPEEDSSEDGSSDAHHGALPLTLPNPLLPQVVRAPENVRGLSASRTLTPAAYTRALTVNSIHPSFSPPPLLHVPNAPLFPRSCNSSRSLPPQDPLLSHMFKTRLLRRLEHGLTRSEQRSLAPFASRSEPLPARKGPSLTLDDTAVADAKRLSKHSEGLRRWAERPCFEDRMILYIPAETNATGPGRVPATEIVSVHVSGIGFGVAALEYSETLELLSGIYNPDMEVQPDQDQEPFWSPTFEQTPPLSLTPSPLLCSPTSSGPSTPTAASTSPALTGSTSPELAGSPSPPTPRSQPYKAMPSPLRREHGSSVPSSPPPKSSSPPVVLPRTSSSKPGLFIPASPSPPPRPVVRFAQSNQEERRDNVPLGYVMRIKQQRAEKARFLEAERARRIQDDQRQKREEDLRRRQEEAHRQEEERRVRRAQEEERRQRAYAEEVMRARARRDSVRFEPEWERERDKKADVQKDRYSRAAYDTLSPPTPRRQGSEPGVRDASSASRTDSTRPPSMRPPSFSGSTGGSGRGSPVGHGPSLPARSSSTPDVRPHGGRRGSFVSEGGSHTSSAPTSPQWMMSPNGSPRMSMNMGLLNVPQMPMMVPVPVPVAVPMQMQMQMQMPYGMGMMGMDTPLLPPTPPFIMQQFGPRQSSQERGQGQDQRVRAHSSSPAPQQSQQHRGSQPRAHSSSPTHTRPPRDAFSLPPPAHRSSLAPPSPSSHPRSPQQAPSSPSSHARSHLPAPLRTPREHAHQRRSSADIGLQRTSARTDRDHEDRRSTNSGPAPSRPSPRHHSAVPPAPAVPPVPVREPRSSWAVPQQGFQILSRPTEGRRQTMIS